MLQRILEPEVMDTELDAREYDEMDFVESNTRFADDALALLGRGGGEVLDAGTGTGQIATLLCEHSTRVRVTALDLAHHMLGIGEAKVRGRPYADRIEWVHGDTKKLPFAAARFDMVVANSTHHHIPEPLKATRELMRVLRPRGAILFRDLMRPATMDDAWTIVRTVAAGDSSRQQQLFFDSLCAALTLDEVRAMTKAAGLIDVVVRTSSDRHWSLERQARPLPRP